MCFECSGFVYENCEGQEYCVNTNSRTYGGSEACEFFESKYQDKMSEVTSNFNKILEKYEDSDFLDKINDIFLEALK